MVAIVLAPMLVIRYRHFLNRRRLNDLYANLWNSDGIERYVRLFGSRKTGKSEASDKDLNEAIEEEFFRVHSFQSYLLPLLLLSVVSAASVIAVALWADAVLRQV